MRLAVLAAVDAVFIQVDVVDETHFEVLTLSVALVVVSSSKDKAVGSSRCKRSLDNTGSS